MDPNACLQSLLELAKKLQRDYDDTNGNGIDQEEADELASSIVNLHEWLMKGGFPPEMWKKAFEDAK